MASGTSRCLADTPRCISSQVRRCTAGRDGTLQAGAPTSQADSPAPPTGQTVRARCVPDRGGGRGVLRSLTDSLPTMLTCGGPGQHGIIHEPLSSGSRVRVALGARYHHRPPGRPAWRCRGHRLREQARQGRCPGHPRARADGARSGFPGGSGEPGAAARLVPVPARTDRIAPAAQSAAALVAAARARPLIGPNTRAARSAPCSTAPVSMTDPAGARAARRVTGIWKATMAAAAIVNRTA